MAQTRHPVDLDLETLIQGGALTPTVRRDITDLNRQFLELGLAPELAADPRFGWSEDVRSDLLRTDPATRERMAACPFTLFEIVLPALRPAAGAAPSRVADEAGAIGGEPWTGRCVAFVHFALFVAWRLADATPLATRIALGLSPGTELRLNEMSPSEVVLLAGCQDLIRPRWPAHPRFWATLRGAARVNSPSSRQWAHCFGMCLLGADLSDRGVPGSSPTPRHRPPR
jgi:hypothetical protein